MRTPIIRYECIGKSFCPTFSKKSEWKANIIILIQTPCCHFVRDSIIRYECIGEGLLAPPFAKGGITKISFSMIAALSIRLFGEARVSQVNVEAVLMHQGIRF